MPKYPENLIHVCRPVLEHYELDDEMGRMFVRSMHDVPDPGQPEFGASDRERKKFIAALCSFSHPSPHPSILDFT